MLIVLASRLWLRRLEDSNPELAKQIHVFSSFFYKKLNRKKWVIFWIGSDDAYLAHTISAEEGYDSVRKWTAKFNIFNKKYIIVPINEK